MRLSNLEIIHVIVNYHHKTYINYIDIWNHRVMMSISNRVNASFNHDNFDNVLWAVEIKVLSMYLSKYAKSKLPFTWSAGYWGFVWQCCTWNQQLLVHLCWASSLVQGLCQSISHVLSIMAWCSWSALIFAQTIKWSILIKIYQWNNHLFK